MDGSEACKPVQSFLGFLRQQRPKYSQALEAKEGEGKQLEARSGGKGLGAQLQSIRAEKARPTSLVPTPLRKRSAVATSAPPASFVVTCKKSVKASRAPPPPPPQPSQSTRQPSSKSRAKPSGPKATSLAKRKAQAGHA
eukprot:2649438-Amphidinium_carterae.1